MRERLKGPWGLFVGIVGVVGTGLTIYGLLAGSGATASLSPDQTRLLDTIPPKLGTHCRPYDPGFYPEYTDLVIADVKCEPIDPGPDSLKFHLFTDRFDLKAFLRLQKAEITDDWAGCTSTDLPYASPWVDAHGTLEGELLCADYADRSKVIWSYDDLLIVGSAGAPRSQVDPLHEWWQRDVRFDGRNPGAAPRRHLLSLLPASFGSCDPLPVLLPMALAAVLCRPGNGISSAGAQLFPNRRLLADYIDLHASRQGIDEEGCGVSPFSHMDYGPAPTYRPLLGHLVCYPEDGAEWISWSADNPLVYAFASRADNDYLRLYHQWSHSLSYIRNLNPEGSS